MLEVAEIPVNVVVLSDLPTGVPTALVAEIPVNGTPIFKVTDPNEKVAEIPVSVVVLSDLPTGVPVEEVNEIPVKGTPIAIIGVPTLVVAEIPLGLTTTSSIDPQPFRPQVKVPQPG